MKAGNSGPFTLDGTRSYLVGRTTVAVIDPGPDVEAHVRALSSALSEARKVRILLTHGHGDHAGSAANLADAVGASVWGPPSAGFQPLEGGAVIPTDAGELLAVETPGHTRDHLAFFWPRARALFAGDLVLGRGDTTWLGEYPGCVADYLASLQRVGQLAPDLIYPAHGKILRNPGEVLEAYRNHRLERLRELRDARDAHPGADPDELVRVIYGPELPPRLEKAARASIEAMLHHLRTVSAPG